ncbi:MAG: efflux RND transporter periplasmic adaptor subunit [Alphaproteobacteria bacterium]|nr:efflux RND transporter periplasmic adaptor subunit [Alphaproteobacteria bacterium]
MMIKHLATKLSGLPRRTKIAGGIGAGVLVVAVGIVIASGGNGGEAAYRVAAVDRGPVIKSISSTGTLRAVVTVLVGSQVSGQIIELPADFNSQVRAGEVIARIDPATFETRVGQSEAELAVAQANVVQRGAALDRAGAELRNAQAQVASARARVTEANNNLARKRALLEREFASQAQVDTARTGRESAVAALNAALATVEARRAQLAMADADVTTAHAQVKQREAALHNNQVDLDRTIIRSPVDGVVIERKVDLGQTVAASLQAPDLFTIAQDLRDMQVEVSVDEADIGQVTEGLKVKFNVDAFPGQAFEGSVSQVRLAPDVVQNVVTYKVIVAADNPNQRLLPGMTANVEIIAGERADALRIPNAALRFVPEGVETSEAGNDAPGGFGGGPGAGGPGGPGGGGPGGSGRGAEAAVERLTAQLELTEDQQAELLQAISSNRQRFQEFRAQGLSFPEIRQRMRALTGEALRPLLTSEQLQKFEETTGGGTRRRVRIWVVGDGGAPEPVALIVGISDNSNTEIIRVLGEAGEPLLTDGDEVIVGVDRQRTAETQRRRFRFGF